MSSTCSLSAFNEKPTYSLSARNMKYPFQTEVFIYFVAYVSFIVYGTRQIYLLNDVIDKNNTVANAFSAGWDCLDGRKRDSIDVEWESWKIFCSKYTWWFVFYPIITEIVRHSFNTSNKAIVRTHLITGMLFILHRYNIIILLILLIKAITFTIIMNRKCRTTVWIYAMLWITIIHLLKTESMGNIIDFYLYFNYSDRYELTIILSWILLRTLSFALDYTQLDWKQENDFDLDIVLGYVFYFPTLLLGPFMLFQRYVRMLKAGGCNDLCFRLKVLFMDITKIAFLYIFVEYALHFLYINILRSNIEIVENLPPWSLYTFGYLMGQFFHMKYVVAYGLSTALAKFERIEMPALPKCIARIHWYSDMWKHFDQGLYEFLYLYIYLAYCQSKPLSKFKKPIASFVTFVFVYVWHGMYLFIFVWSMINFVSLQAERFIKEYFQLSNRLESKEITMSNRKRLIALVSSQIFIPSALSNFYFFGDMAIGNIFVRKTYALCDIFGYLVLNSCTYCIYHVAEAISFLEMKRLKN